MKTIIKAGCILVNKEQKEIANDLKLIQYDITVGKGYIRNYKGFFDIR